MFRFLQLENFQSHEKTRIDFDRGVNVIFGLSQAGKTALARAMRLLIYNRPLGGKFFSDFVGEKGQTKITIGIDGQEDISVIKSIRVNKEGEKVVTATQYQIGGTEFSSPKDQVPDQVQAVLNISELNIQRQFDPPFLVSSSGGEIAKTINRITRLEEVDDWVSELTNEINATNRDIVRMEAEAKSLLQEIDVYKDIEETEKAIVELQTIVGIIARMLIQRNDLDNALIQFEDATRESEKLDEFMVAERYVKKAEKLQQDIDEWRTLADLISEHNKLTDGIIDSQFRLDDLLVIDRDLALSEFNTDKRDLLKRLIEEYEVYRAQYEVWTEAIKAERYVVKAEKLDEDVLVFKHLQTQLMQYECTDQEREDFVEDLKKAKERYMDVLRDVKKCPTCFADINTKHLKEIGAVL